MNQKDISHLEWIYDRLKLAHKEHESLDYMKRFKEIIENERPPKKDFRYNFTKSATSNAECYKSGEPCKYNCSGLCKDSC